jgi:hypothetical protein
MNFLNKLKYFLYHLYFCIKPNAYKSDWRHDPYKGAIIWKYPNGKLHRGDGPAIEWDDGVKEWWCNGIRHRIDGPAVEYSNGTKEWWFFGEKFSEEEHLNQVSSWKTIFCEEL